MILASPFPWFGGKRRVAADVWAAFGRVDNYVEPFFGSGAVLLARPDFDPEANQTETINDADGYVANFWRALKVDPEAVAWWADYPVSETDLHARHGWLVNRRARLTWSLEDPDFYDSKIAGWWVWGIAQWIGSGWCSGAGPWMSNGAHITNGGDAGRGINRQLPHLGNAGQGINRKLPHLGDAGRGINRQLPHPGNAGQGINRQLPHLGNAGRGINRKLPHLGNAGQGERLSAYLGALSERMRRVRVACGDWSRVMGESVTVKHGTTAVFLDPPYSTDADRQEDLYAVDCGQVAHAVREWCIANGDNPALRIVLCGYDGEHQLPGWRFEEGQAGGGAGYGGQGNGRGRNNSKRERLWFSPHCCRTPRTHQTALFLEETAA